MPDIEVTEPIEAKTAAKRKPAAKKPADMAKKTVATTAKAEPATAKAAAAAKKATSAKPTAASKNGSAHAAPKPKAKAPTPPPEPATPMDRAEDTLDELGKVVGGFLASAAKKLRKAAAVGKEELEDLWAEAQAIRRGDVS